MKYRLETAVMSNDMNGIDPIFNFINRQSGKAQITKGI